MGHLYRFVEPVLLLVLQEKGGSYGYDILGSLAEHAFTDGAIEKAVLYRTLRRLEQNGYITSGWDTEEPGPARRVYTLTREGEKHLKEWAQVLAKVAGSMTRFVRRVSSRNSRT
jgi:poly-beta-hydroxybutyrate-responsive repressor